MGEKYNHGSKTEKKGKFTYMESFGKDDSDYAGSGADERGGKLAGGIDNLAHSLSGVSGKN